MASLIPYSLPEVSTTVPAPAPPAPGGVYGAHGGNGYGTPSPPALGDPVGLLPVGAAGRGGHGGGGISTSVDARSPGQCFAESTAPVRGVAGQVAGGSAIFTEATLLIAGHILRSTGKTLVMQGTVDLDVFFAARGASSTLVEGGIEAIGTGRTYLANASLVSRVAGRALVLASAGLAAYVATTAVICNANPEY